MDEIVIKKKKTFTPILPNSVSFGYVLITQRSFSAHRESILAFPWCYTK